MSTPPDGTRPGPPPPGDYLAQTYPAKGYPPQDDGPDEYAQPGYVLPDGSLVHPGPSRPPWRPPRNDGLCVASIATGIASVACLLFFLGPVALGLGIAGRRRAARDGTNGRGMAISGIVLGSLATVLLVISTILVTTMDGTSS